MHWIEEQPLGRGGREGSGAEHVRRRQRVEEPPAGQAARAARREEERPERPGKDHDAAGGALALLQHEPADLREAEQRAGD